MTAGLDDRFLKTYHLDSLPSGNESGYLIRTLEALNQRPADRAHSPLPGSNDRDVRHGNNGVRRDDMGVRESVGNTE